MTENTFQEDPHFQQQQRYWEQLRQELERYKTDLGATNTELAQCLGISRQPLVLFMQDASRGLPIQRWNLVRLWDLLTDPTYSQKKLADAARFHRASLRQQGPDALLKAAGFLPNFQKPSIEIDSSRGQQIHRIVSRLSNLPVSDFAEFITLTDFLEMFVTNSFPGKHKVFESIQSDDSDARTASKEAGIDRIARWVEKNHVPHPPTGVIKQKLRGALSRLTISGKSELNNAEFFELYMSIAENERLSSHIDECLRMRITQCQFTTVTFPLKPFLSHRETDYIWKDIQKASLDAEQYLRPKVIDRRDLEDAVSEPVIEALITCNFRAKGRSVRWRYSASTTHFETMLAALGRGMGYDADLELVDFSTRTLGHKDYSLVRASTAFRPVDHHIDPTNYPTYQSVWVDRSAVLGILQSAVIAVRSWLADNFPDRLSCQSYYDVCRAVAEIDENLVQGKKVLNGYRIQQIDYADGLSANEYLETAVIDKINQLKQGILKQYSKLRHCYEADLDRNYWIAKLACAHSAMIEGNMMIASRLLVEMQDFLSTSGRENLLLQIAYDTEHNLQQFYRGESDIFSYPQQWRVDLTRAIQALSRYINTSKQACGRFDSDIYIQASEVWGRLARLNFCCCDQDEIDHLTASVQQFLMAAYCSSKTGHRHRASHWISNASRACARLGEGDRANAFAELAERIIKRAIEPTYSLEYQDAIRAEVNIAKGERLLLIEKNSAGALDYFLRSFKGSIYIGFTRLIADNLYNIARAAQNLGNYRIRKSFESAFGKDDWKNRQTAWLLNEADQGWQENKIAAEVIQFINKLDKDEDWSSVAPLFKQQAQKIWHGWANFNSSQSDIQHPIEVAMESERFLGRVR